MLDKKSIPQTEQNNNPLNHVGADDNVQLPDNSKVGGHINSDLQDKIQQGLIDSEKLRRDLLTWTVGISLCIIFALYMALICLVHHKENVNWHIVAILALSPTTILFLLIKVLSSKVEQSGKENDGSMPINVKDMPISQWLAQTTKIIESFMEAIKGKK